jgi:hypothetical protein
LPFGNCTFDLGIELFSILCHRCQLFRHVPALQAFVLNDLVAYGKNRRVNPKAFFGELRRGNVYKIAIAYAVLLSLAAQSARKS